MLRIAAVLALLAFVAVLAQATYGIGFWKTIPLGPKDLREDEGYAVHARLDKKYGRPLDDARGYVTEDGIRTGRRAGKNDHVREFGYGWFKILRRNVRFSSTDGTDPRTNGRKYAIVVPRPVPPVLLFGLLGLAAVSVGFAFRKGVVTGLREIRFNPTGGWAGLAVFLAGSALATLLMVSNADYTDQGLVVKGMPYSDALGWNEMSVGLAEGRGFTTEFYTHRPYYSVFLGGLYSLFGPHFVIAKIVNVLSAGLLAAAGYLFVARAFKSVGAGLVMALFLILAPDQFGLLQVTATEQLGLALTVFSVYLTWIGILNGKSLALLAAGIFLGLSNLTRTFTALAFPLYGLILIVYCLRTKSGWLPFLRQAAIFAGGVLLVFGPWIARQKICYGITSISSNSADLIYAAAAYGRWDSRQFDEADDAGIADNNAARYPFFNQRLKEVVAEDPGRYIKFVSARFVEYIGASFDPSSPAFRLALGLVAFFAALRLCWRRRSAAGLVALAVVLPILNFTLKSDGLTFDLPIADNGSDQVPVPLIYPEKETQGGALLLLAVLVPPAFFPLRRIRVVAVCLLLATLLGSGLLSALVGNFGLSRTASFGGWVYVGISFAGLTGLFHLIGLALNRLRPLEEQSTVPDKDTVSADFFSTVAAVSIMAVTVLGIALMLIAFWGRGSGDRTAWALEDQAESQLRKWAEVQFAESISANQPKELSIDIVYLGDYRAHLDADEEVGHWSNIFDRRDYRRTVAKVRAGIDPTSSRVGGSLLPVHFPGHLPEDLPRWSPYALVGLKQRYETPGSEKPGYEKVDVNALALVPIANNQDLLFEKAVMFKKDG